MSGMPTEVSRIGASLAAHPQHELAWIAGRLIVDEPEVVAMWMSIRRGAQQGDIVWIQNFLHAAREASDLPAYHHLATSDRHNLAKKLEEMAAALTQLLTENRLDVNIVYNDGLMFKGFFVYEEFGESNQASIDADGLQKLPASRVIAATASRAAQKIRDEPLAGKAGENARAIRFVRIMAVHNDAFYGNALNRVVATAANAIFDTAYSESDVAKLRNRQ